MNIIFSISGGLGKSILATAVCQAIKKKYIEDRLIVVTGYPEAFQNLPYVYMAVRHNEDYFFEKFVENQEVKFFATEPYMITEHILRKEHLIETWCKMYDVPYNGELPEVPLNEREVTFFSHKYRFEKPTMILQTNGGGGHEIKYSWARDMPMSVAKVIVEQYRHQYDILHIRREDQFPLEHTIHIQDGYKQIAFLIATSSKRVLIDSFCQHMAAGLRKASTVLWIVNTPKVFGYEIHDNILSNPETIKPDLRNASFGKYNIVGALHEFPYETETQIFNIDKILSSIDSQ